MFVGVPKSKLLNDLTYLWIPHMLVEPSCRKDLVLLDCFFYSALNKDALMVLLSRRIRRKLDLEVSAPVECPMLFSSNCNVAHYQKTLRNIEESLKKNNIENLMLRPQDARSRALVAEVFRAVLKHLCYPEPPLSLSQVYVLVGVNINKKRTYIVLGNETIRSVVLEEVLYGDLNGVETIIPYLAYSQSSS
jgi:hypothetical protein